MGEAEPDEVSILLHRIQVQMRVVVSGEGREAGAEFLKGSEVTLAFVCEVSQGVGDVARHTWALVPDFECDAVEDEVAFDTLAEAFTLVREIAYDFG